MHSDTMSVSIAGFCSSRSVLNVCPLRSTKRSLLSLTQVEGAQCLGDLLLVGNFGPNDDAFSESCSRFWFGSVDILCGWATEDLGDQVSRIRKNKTARSRCPDWERNSGSVALMAWECVMRRDLDDVIQGWPYDPEPGEHLAREVRARDGRKVLQVRIELGVLQLEVTGRPDGVRPHGFVTYLDYLRHSAASRGQTTSAQTPRWSMSAQQCADSDREFIQFYHRRVAWRALGRHDRAIQDADHTLALMDFVRRHGIGEEYIASHEQFRGIVLFHRTEAAFALALEKHRPEEAIDALREGIDQLNTHQRVWWEVHDTSESPDRRACRATPQDGARDSPEIPR